MSYSRRQLYAVGEPFGESATQRKLGGRIYGGGGGGGSSQPSHTTNTSTSIPDYAKPYVEKMIGQTSALTDINQNPYKTYGQERQAAFTPLQQQVQTGVAGMKMPGQFSRGTDFADAAGMMGLGSAVDAGKYGQQGLNAGLAGGRMGSLAVQDAYDRANAATTMANNYGQQGQDYGHAGARVGTQAAQQAAADAAQGKAAGYGYGAMGAQAGAQGQQSGLMGQNIGTQGGAQYGSMGAGFGSQAAGLSNQALGYGQAGSSSGQIGQQLALAAANRYGDMGSGYGSQAAALAPQAQQYGQGAADIGRMGLRAEALGQDITGQARGYAAQAAGAGQQYANQATNPNAMQSYMSPYMQNVVDVQNREAARNSAIQGTQQQAQAAQAGALQRQGHQIQ